MLVLSEHFKCTSHTKAFHFTHYQRFFFGGLGAGWQSWYRTSHLLREGTERLSQSDDMDLMGKSWPGNQESSTKGTLWFYFFVSTLDTFTVMSLFMLLMHFHTNLLMLCEMHFFFILHSLSSYLSRLCLCQLVLKLSHSVITIKLRAMVAPVREKKPVTVIVITEAAIAVEIRISGCSAADLSW